MKSCLPRGGCKAYVYIIWIRVSARRDPASLNREKQQTIYTRYVVYLVSFLFDVRKGCRSSNDSLSLRLYQWPPMRNVSCANGSHLWNCFQQETRNKNNDRESTKDNNVNKHGRLWTRGVMLTRVSYDDANGPREGLPHSREPSLPPTLPSAIMARVICEVVCQLDWVSSGGPLKPRWAVNAFTKWVVWVLLESLYPQLSWEGAVFVNTKPSYYQLHT